MIDDVCVGGMGSGINMRNAVRIECFRHSSEKSHYIGTPAVRRIPDAFVHLREKKTYELLALATYMEHSATPTIWMSLWEPALFLTWTKYSRFRLQNKTIKNVRYRNRENLYPAGCIRTGKESDSTEVCYEF